MTLPEVRYVGIIADGPIDEQVIGRLVGCLLGDQHIKTIILKQNFHDLTQTFLRQAKTKGYALDGAPAKDLRKEIINVLFTAVKQFRDESENLTRNDLLIQQFSFWKIRQI